MEEKCDSNNIPFFRDLHVTYFKNLFYDIKRFKTLDPHKTTLLYFIVNSLSLLGELDNEIKTLSIDYIMNNIVKDNQEKLIGFRGGTFTGFSYNKNYNKHNINDLPHLAATYTSLCILRVCGYEFPDTFKSILNELKYYQREDGSIKCQKWDTEYDSRFIYCACVLPKLLSFDSIDLDKVKLVKYLSQQANYEGGYGMIEGSESNAGLTYCNVASLYLLNEEKKIDKEKLVNWLAMRQTTIGINGRTGKIPDSCYCFWVLATTRILGNYDIFDESIIIQFLMNCQNSEIGGFSKHSGNIEYNFPDVLHSFYSLAALSLLNFERLGKIDPLLAISLR